MKILRASKALAFLMISTGCVASEGVKDFPTQEKLYGTWNCKVSIKESDANISMDFNVNYVRNGKSNSFGIMTISSPEIQGLEYSVASSGTWEYQDRYLIESLSEVKIINISHPGLDEIFNLEDMFPQNISESSEVVLLTESSLHIKPEGQEEVYACERYVHNS